MNNNKRIVIFKHSHLWSGDRCSRLLLEKGYQVDWYYPYEVKPLPDPLLYDAAIVFGCRHSVNDPIDWIKLELQWIEACLKTNRPLLGLCFGGQLLARVLGAGVARHPEKLTEIGFTEVMSCVGEDDCIKPPPKIFQWHNEAFDLPDDCLRLCRSERFPNQAFRYGDNSFGFQFHPEVTRAVIASWFSGHDDYESEGLDLASRANQLAYAEQNDHEISDWFSGFLDGWLKQNTV